MSATFEELLSTRRSVRRFTSSPVDRATVTRLIDAAVTAPSASNKQPWRFLIVESRGVIDAMAGAVREATARIARHVPESSQASLLAYGDYFTRFEQAPLVIVPIARGHALLSNLVDEVLPEADRAAIARMESQSAVIGTSLALQNLLLMAHAMGLGASGMTGPLVAEPALRSILAIPDGWTLLALVPVGWPAESPPPTDRKPSDKVVRWL